MSSQNSPLCELLRQQILAARRLDYETAEANRSGVMLEIPETGKILSTAYEQLRNAAEYSEEHLLLQRAIKRFCKRNLFLTSHRPKGLGTELIVELVQAGYLQGGNFSKTTADKLDKLIEKYMSAFGDLRQAHVKHDVAMDWVLALIASETENLLSPHHSQHATLFFAYHYFLQAIPKDSFAYLPDIGSYELCLYIAVHQALLKSDLDIVRYDLMELYKQSPEDVAGFRHLNQQIDKLFSGQLTQQLKRIIGRHGAPFRILKSLIDSRADAADILSDQQLFMDAYSRQIAQDYQQVHKRLDRRLVKSIAFIFITKMLVGVAVEIPYDLIVRGHVAVFPLGFNLLFPAIYMASLTLNLNLPSASNTRSVENYMQKLLYDDKVSQIAVPAQRKSSLIQKLMYFLVFVVPLVTTVFILQKIGFNVVQMFIFFVFFSTASFLGFRLGMMVRELELTTRQSGFLASQRDYFYLPFIVVGQWLSRKYSKINAVGRFLDVAIELPLKSLLRLIRQWMRFLNEKHEELY